MIKEPRFNVSTSPYVHDRITTPRIMWEVLLTLVPVVGAAWYMFGLGAILVILASVLGCLATEWVFSIQKPGWKTLGDGSALLTGVLLGLCLPPGFPLWMAFLGGVVAIGMGKRIWGGLGNNIFNPALVGRAFLQAAFPSAITTWSDPLGPGAGLRGMNASIPFMQGTPLDGASGATPLSKFKFEQVFANLDDLVLGTTSGSLGETSGFLILLAGIYLASRKIIEWRVPVSIFLTVILFSGIFWILDSTQYPSPGFMLFSGGLILGTIYMATDPVSSPLTPKGLWWYGFGIGILVVSIRLWGGLPEGVMYAILIMNAATPLLNRYTKIKPYGYQ